MSGEQEAFQVRVYANMLEIGVGETFGDLRARTHEVAADVSAGAVHTDGRRDTFADDDVIVEELGRLPAGWVIVFEDPPLEDYAAYRYPGQ